MRRLLFAALAVFAVAGAPASVHAADRATAGQRSVIARSAHVPARCIMAFVSEVDASWASWSFRQPIGKRCRRAAQKYSSVEVTVFVRRSSGRWRRSGGTSDCGRPARVPVAVWRDMAPACAGFDDDGMPLEP